VPLLSFFLLAGCYLSHEASTSAPDATARSDAGPRRDAGRRDAGDIPSECRPIEVRTACAEGTTRPFLTAGAPGELVLFSDACHCGGEIVCSVRDVAAPGRSPGRIEIATQLCGEGRCAACTEPYEVTCALEGLDPGEYHVYVNGAGPVFDLQAAETPGVPPTTLCQEIGSQGGGLCEFPGALLAWAPERVCFSPSVEPGRVVIDLEAETSCVFEPGPCDVYLFETDDGGHLEVRPRVRSCDEGTPTWDCTGSSGTLRRSCSALHVRPGLYEMSLQDGTPLGRFEVGAMTLPPACFDL
jgi:hypothetical protein